MIKICKEKKLGGKNYRCYFELTLKVVGGKWKPIILYHLAVNGIMRYSEFLRTMPEITERMLVRQLKELEQDGLVERKSYNEVPPRVEYSITTLGRSLIPILVQMREWGVMFERVLGGQDLFLGDEYESPEPLAITP